MSQSIYDRFFHLEYHRPRKEPNMKFTDGYWQMRPGMTPHYAAQVYEVIAEPDSLTVYAPVGRLQGRGHTVNQPLLTVRYSSPLEGVIRVQIVHHRGTIPRTPGFMLATDQPSQVSIANDEHTATLTSGDLRVRIHKGDDWL